MRAKAERDDTTIAIARALPVAAVGVVAVGLAIEAAGRSVGLIVVAMVLVALRRALPRRGG